MAKTTKKDFELFKKECKKWIDIVGLKDWHFWYDHDKTDDNCIAQYDIDDTGRSCVVYFTKGLDDKLTRHDITSAAFHEIIEIYIRPLRKMALTAHSYEFVDEATHRIVRMLENVLFPKY